MKRRQALQNLAAAGLLAAPASAAWREAFAERFRQDILGHWVVERDYSMTIFDAMPKDKLGWRPTPEVRSFGEQAVHFARANTAYFSPLEVAGVTPPPLIEEDTADHAKVRAFLVASSEFVRQCLEKLGEEEFMRRDVPLLRTRTLHTTQDIFLRAALHTAHHRGQMVVYLRLNGITPPDWQFAPQGG